MLTGVAHGARASSVAMGAAGGWSCWVVAFACPAVLDRWWPAVSADRVWSCDVPAVRSLCLCSISIGAADAELVALVEEEENICLFY